MKTLLKYRLILLIVLLPCALFGQKKTVVKPPAPPDYLKQGNEYFLRENYLQALDSYNQFLKDSAETAEVSFGLGKTYLKLGEFEKGMDYLAKAVKSDKKYDEYILSLNYDEIPFKFLRSNFTGDKLIRKVSNGFFISPVIFSSLAQKSVVNEVTQLPLWGESVEISGYGAELSFNYNPLTVSFSYLSGEGSLKTLKKDFALPPSLPGQQSPLNSSIRFTSVSGALHWTPAVIFWGYAYPLLGASYEMNEYKNQLPKSYSFVCLNAGMLVKYKKLFLKGIYKLPLENKVLESQMQIQAGIMFNFFN